MLLISASSLRASSFVRHLQTLAGHSRRIQSAVLFQFLRQSRFFQDSRLGFLVGWSTHGAATIDLLQWPVSQVSLTTVHEERMLRKLDGTSNYAKKYIRIQSSVSSGHKMIYGPLVNTNRNMFEVSPRARSCRERSYDAMARN